MTTSAHSGRYADWYERHFPERRAESLGSHHPVAPYGHQAKPETIQRQRITAKYEGRKNQCPRHFQAKPCPGCEDEL